MARSNDPLTAATTAILKPAVAVAGFEKLSTRLFARIRNDILQWFDIQVSKYGSRDFCLNHSSQPLFVPSDHFAVMIGGRIPQGKSGEGWWPSKTHDAADESMREIASIFQSRVLPWFEQTSTAAGLLDALLGLGDAWNGNTHLARAACYNRLGQIENAKSSLSQAEKRYRAAHEEMPSRSWCLQGLENCQRLRDCLAVSDCDGVLGEWVEYSIAALKISRLEGRQRTSG